jgi:hypothetical protein
MRHMSRWAIKITRTFDLLGTTLTSLPSPIDFHFFVSSALCQSW